MLFSSLSRIAKDLQIILEGFLQSVMQACGTSVVGLVVRSFPYPL